MRSETPASIGASRASGHASGPRVRHGRGMHRLFALSAVLLVACASSAAAEPPAPAPPRPAPAAPAAPPRPPPGPPPAAPAAPPAPAPASDGCKPTGTVVFQIDHKIEPGA